VILKFLHSIGLTNLSDADVAKYYRARTAELSIIKRLLDFLLSLLALILFAPLFLIIALAIKITSPGPVFLIQERMGFDKRPFRMFKFRTMMFDSEEGVNGPRITMVGRFLQATSIDELPQLINVLKGNMSLVGPRPIPERIYENLGQEWRPRRFSVRPGITGLWQIQEKNSIPFEKWLQLDLQYVDHPSLWLDLKILAETVVVGLKGSGVDLLYPDGGSDKLEERLWIEKTAA
jgi:lipopolysaccharide/colanic/teichoic acid biosynthesis glycosyltransferase